jgi:hypothetical protein
MEWCIGFHNSITQLLHYSTPPLLTRHVEPSRSRPGILDEPCNLIAF